MGRFVIMLLLAAILILLLPYLFFQQNQPDAANCYKTEERIVRGDSLSGIVEPNSTVKILFGYYGCNEIRRGDIVAYNYSGNSNPIIKIVMGLPGDTFHLQEAKGGWNILINGGILTNSGNKTSYLLGEQGYRMLSLYETDYKGIIPEDAYLLLGNLAFGSIDSSHFGLVDKSDILGKVEYAG